MFYTALFCSLRTRLWPVLHSHQWGMDCASGFYIRNMLSPLCGTHSEKWLNCFSKVGCCSFMPIERQKAYVFLFLVAGKDINTEHIWNSACVMKNILWLCCFQCKLLNLQTQVAWEISQGDEVQARWGSTETVNTLSSIKGNMCCKDIGSCFYFGKDKVVFFSDTGGKFTKENIRWRAEVGQNA